MIRYLIIFALGLLLRLIKRTSLHPTQFRAKSHIPQMTHETVPINEYGDSDPVSFGLTN